MPGAALAASGSKRVAHDANDLTFSLYRATACKGENLAVSGFVTRHALGTVAAGSPARAETWRTLGYGTSERPGRAELDGWKAATEGLAYTSGARVFYERSLHLDAAFEKRAADAFDQTFEALDFKRSPRRSRVRVGEWVEETTGGQLRGPLPEDILPDAATLVVGTAFGLKAAWQRPFDATMTEQHVFTQRSGATLHVPMMRQLAPAEYGVADGVTLLDLPLGAHGDKLSVLFVLPPVGTPLETIERGLDRTTYEGWLSRLGGNRVDCEIPRFKVETMIDVTSALEAVAGTQLDTAHLFAEGAQGPRLKLVHQTSITVDEGGVKASASSVGSLSIAAADVTIPRFIADRPFLFVIRDRMSPGSPVLLLGRVGKPLNPE